jgi:threonine aldolase
VILETICPFLLDPDDILKEKSMIDLRSDTVTRPTREMLDAIFHAQVGDDVFGDDPTVKDLEKKVAQMFGMKAAVYCPSGTMTNQIAIKAHTGPGDEVICDRTSHIYTSEGGGIALNSGCSVRLLHGDRGRFTAVDVLENINDVHNEHLAFSRVVAIENTSNRGGGSCYDFKELEQIARVCRQHNLAYHLDGARLFNALVRNNETPEQYGEIFDSISICLSKGLGAPVGSVLMGNKDFISRARRFRKAFGGGMRQAGYLAAAGIYAIENNIDRISEDHRRAKELESVLKSLQYIEKVIPVETNIIIFKLNNVIQSKDFLYKLQEKGVLMVEFGPKTIRAITHLDIDDDDLGIVTKALKQIQ